MRGVSRPDGTRQRGTHGRARHSVVDRRHHRGLGQRGHGVRGRVADRRTDRDGHRGEQRALPAVAPRSELPADDRRQAAGPRRGRRVHVDDAEDVPPRGRILRRTRRPGPRACAGRLPRRRRRGHERLRRADGGPRFAAAGRPARRHVAPRRRNRRRSAGGVARRGGVGAARSPGAASPSRSPTRCIRRCSRWCSPRGGRR